MEGIDGIAAVNAMLRQQTHEPAVSQPDPPAWAELIRSDRGLELDYQWRVTLGNPVTPRMPRRRNRAATQELSEVLKARLASGGDGENR